MQLTDEQVKAAEAQGCHFVEATEAQVRQFAMQRRVFQIGGKPYLATRADGFYETAGTLMARIAEAMKQRPAIAPAKPSVVEQVDEEAPQAAAAPEVEEAAPAAEMPEVAAEPAAVEPVREVAPPALSGGSSAVVAAMQTIAKGYARGHQVDATQLSTLLTTVHRTLSGLEPSRSRSRGSAQS
ncbi:hypothetical protein MHZ93_19385 [Roseomonas sp. ACRSG]|nr:hypothetical protein [Roseomonas sp. ACRSG]